MPLANFSNLDFDQVKDTLQEYLKSNSNFTDYDFEGSNLSSILDVLAYNTYITSYNANMITNEVFIDTATLRENVVSLARNIGYVPRSSRSAQAVVNFSVDLGTNDTKIVTLKAGQVALGTQQGSAYIFSIPDDITANVNSNGIANFENISTHKP